MKIAGLQNLSLVDFPGHLAAIVFVQGCNFRCGYCHNSNLVTFDKHFDFPQEKIFDHILRRNKMIEGVVITGGEPSIHSDLPDFIKRVKDTGLKVKLDTNGFNAEQLENLIRARLLDYVAIDIKTSFPKYSLVTNQVDIIKKVKESVCITMLSTVSYEFRTTCVPGIVDEEDFYSLREDVKGAKKYCLQQFRPVNTYDKSFLEVKPYDMETLLRFQDILKSFVEEVEIRGV